MLEPFDTIHKRTVTSKERATSLLPLVCGGAQAARDVIHQLLEGLLVRCARRVQHSVPPAHALHLRYNRIAAEEAVQRFTSRPRNSLTAGTCTATVSEGFRDEDI